MWKATANEFYIARSSATFANMALAHMTAAIVAISINHMYYKHKTADWPMNGVGA